MTRFYCPFCNEELTALEGTAFKLKGVLKSDMFECSGIFYLQATPGQYGVIHDDFIRLKQGAKVDFRCPESNCDRSFTTQWDDDLSQVRVVKDDEKEDVAIFNRIYGKRASFVVDYEKKALKESFGVDKEDYIHDFDSEINFFW